MTYSRAAGFLPCLIAFGVQLDGQRRSADDCVHTGAGVEHAVYATASISYYE